MKPLQDQNLKVNIQILDEQDNILISSKISQGQVNDLNVFHGISGVEQVYNLLVEELKVRQSEREE
jgi:hypothetical protein